MSGTTASKNSATETGQKKENARIASNSDTALEVACISEMRMKIY